MRDITTNPEWERAYQYDIPVLAKLRPDGSEVSCLKLIQLVSFRISCIFMLA